ncbi:MAG: molybdate ABC transporter substrate-binding protein, partial [Candidatus Polarisedimenticolia bacterium]
MRGLHALRLACALLVTLLGARKEAAAAPPVSGTGGPPEILLYAAASLRDVLRDLQPACETATGSRLVFNFGASSDLARQIVAAGRADLFFSADEGWMDEVGKAGLVTPGTRRSPLSNVLVVVIPADSGLRIGDASDLASVAVRRLAIANPEVVPAGRYARGWLEQAGVWSRLSDRIVPAIDVRAAMAAVESGAVEAGVVYRTDAAVSRRVRIALEVPPAEGPRISYALAALRGGAPADAGRAVAAWL